MEGGSLTRIGDGRIREASPFRKLSVSLLNVGEWEDNSASVFGISGDVQSGVGLAVADDNVVFWCWRTGRWLESDFFVDVESGMIGDCSDIFCICGDNISFDFSSFSTSLKSFNGKSISVTNGR